ncbi:MAG: WD40/YVTN/BNR-like repeat-containing protein, partial [Calditrichia bacterium]
LQSSGHSGCTPQESGWGNYVLEFRFKPVENFNADALFIDVRHNSNNYYHFAYFSDRIYFNKILNGAWQWQEHTGPSVPFQFALGQWYDFKFDLEGAMIKFFINDQIIFEYNDQSNPITYGSFYINTYFELRAYFDDFLVTGESPPLEGNWVRTGGPWGGIGYDVRIDPTDPNIMYVTDQWAGNHKSTNGGATWYPNNSGIETAFGSTGQSIPIFTIRIDPNNTKNVWCGTFGKRGIYRSTDQGEHWEKKVNGIPEFPCGITFRGIAIRPGNSNVVFCAVEIPLCPEEVPEGKSSASRGKVFKSTDFGENWREVLDSDALVRHIWINPENPDIMYVSTGIFDRDCVKEEGVWKSIDGGETWFHTNTGLTDLTVGGLFMDPRDPDNLWASTGREPPWSGDGTGEIFKTANGADSWTKVFPKGSRTVWNMHSITTSGPNSNIIYAASEGTFYRSMDGGTSWEENHYNIPGVYTGIPVGIVAHPTDENTVFINSYSGGVFGSVDGGKTWKPYNTGYTGAEMLDIIVDPADPLQAFAVGRSGIAKTYDGGMTWEGAGNVIVGAPGMGIGPIAEFTILADNHQNRNSFLSSAFWSPHLLKTTDKFNWVVIHDFRNDGTKWGHGIGAMQYAHNDSNFIYVGLRYRTLPFLIDRPQHYDPNIISYGMYKSTNGGLSWSEINNGL